jgi:LacI family transcriptional regulator
MKPRRRILIMAGWLWPQMTNGLARYAREANWHLHLGGLVSGGFPRGLDCDGMLVFHSERPDLKRLARKQAAICPTVLISGMKPIVQAPTVMEDNIGIGRMAAEHFLERGFRQFAWLANDDRQVSRDRRAGFRAAVEAAGCSCHCIDWQKSDEQRWSEYSHRVAKQLEALPRPLALFTEDDSVAVNAVEICRDHGLRVPEDVAVLGVGNDTLLCEFSGVPLTSIEIDWSELVYRAAELLDRLLAGKPLREETLVVPPRRVVTRTSTDIYAVPQADISRALEFIREHYRQPITVRHVAKALAVNRRTLENHFRRHLHRGLAEEIRQRRLGYAQELLIETELTITKIAQLSGFEDPFYFAKLFKNVCGVPPIQYRKDNRHPTLEGLPLG